MKKSILYFVIFFLCFGTLQAQVSSDPNSEFYDDVQVWETEGLVSNLPDMRPYPLTIVKKILNSVIKNGTAIDKEKALEWQNTINGKGIEVYAVGTLAAKKSEGTDTTTEIYNVDFGVSGDKEIIEGLAFSYDIGTIIQNDSFDSILPSTFSNPYDDSGDIVHLGFLESVIDVNSAFSYGTEHFTIQGGITRSSFGPFYDTSIVIAPDTYHTGNLTATIYAGNFTFQQSLFSLTATDDTGESSGSGKLMALHEISYAPFTWLKLGFFETVIWEDSFQFSYALPVSYMVGQSLGGYEDNIQMGLTAQIRPLYGLLWNNQILIDDINMNDIVTLDFDTRITAALESQLAWTPSVTFDNDDSFCKLVTLDFFFVNAYMYSHRGTEYEDFSSLDYTNYNYTNFTTHGEQLSTEIEPNSYRVKLKAEFEPVEDLTITPFVSLMQHGNVNESISTEEATEYLESEAGEYSTDGSAFNTPYVNGEYIDAYINDWIFLEQEHIETTFQTGAEATYKIPIKTLKNYTTILSFSISYTFEYIKNCMDKAGDMFPGSNENYTTQTTTTTTTTSTTDGTTTTTSSTTDGTTTTTTTTDGTTTTTSSTTSTADADDVQEAIDDWVSRLYDTFNNYLTLSIKYQY
ncbi:MAG: hypothetical protein BKP49_09040 [Treponema sp. CETP13]|nr:MAG: hypothetical protein BKP49_09040 [Treponema sp. CETP13]